jgi:hypothetical protein
MRRALAIAAFAAALLIGCGGSEKSNACYVIPPEFGGGTTCEPEAPRFHHHSPSRGEGELAVSFPPLV